MSLFVYFTVGAVVAVAAIWFLYQRFIQKEQVSESKPFIDVTPVIEPTPAVESTPVVETTIIEMKPATKKEKIPAKPKTARASAKPKTPRNSKMDVAK